MKIFIMIITMLLSCNLFADNLKTWQNLTNKMAFPLQKGPSGVPFGGIGTGYFEISPEGYVNRNCINNVHESYIEKPDGTFLALWEKNGNSKNIVRLQKDNINKYNMPGVKDINYKGLFPIASFDFNSNTVTKVNLKVYSSLVPQDIKNSSLPVVWYEITLQNTGNTKNDVSILLSFADIIGRGIKDTTRYNEENFNMDANSEYWHFLTPPDTLAENISYSNFKGIEIHATKPIEHSKQTLQNYNENISLMAENLPESIITTQISDISDTESFSNFISNGTLDKRDINPKRSENNVPNKAIAAAIKTSLKKGESKTIRFMISWYMPEPQMSQKTPKGSLHIDMNYAKYYHNYFKSSESLNKYAIKSRANNLISTIEWQIPILSSSLPDFLKFKIINSAYTIYTNSVLNKNAEYSILEGGMGGLGGTMDQKLSSHPFTQKFFTELDKNENQQFANYPETHGEIPHFDMHYYDGINTKVKTEDGTIGKKGSMIDNTGSWLIQLLKNYSQTGDKTPITENYERIKTAMAFLETRFEENMYIPNWYTTYDDLPHPSGFIYSGILYLSMLDCAAKAAQINNDTTQAAKYMTIYKKTEESIEKLFIPEENNGYYAYGINIQTQKPISEIIHAGTLAGQFISRYSGFGDVIDINKANGALEKFLSTAIQNSPGYYSPKVYNFKTNEYLDMIGSSCWPFYQDSYIGMAAIQQGYTEDGLTLLEATQTVHADRGYLWTQSLWTPAYLSYMTAPVSWFITDVLAGCAIDVNTHTLTLGLTKINDKGSIPLYYPDFWASLEYDYNKKSARFIITKVFGNSKHSFDKLVLLPAGIKSSDAKHIDLKSKFSVKLGNYIDLTAYFNELTNSKYHNKILKPGSKYEDRRLEKTANGTGLKKETFQNDDLTNLISENVIEQVSEKNIHMNSVRYSGYLLPKYEQNYTFTVLSNGGTRLYINNTLIIDNWDNKSLNKLEGEYSFNENKLYPIRLECRNTDETELRWWSTSQTSDIIIKNRLYPPFNINNIIDATQFSKKSDGIQQEGEHIGFIRSGDFITFENIDFKNNEITLGVTAASDTQGGNIKAYTIDSDGKETLIGEITIPKTQHWNDFQTFISNKTVKTSGIKDMRLDFSGNDGFLFNIKDIFFNIITK